MRVCRKIELAEKEGTQCKENLLSDRQMRFPQSHGSWHSAKNFGETQDPDTRRLCCASLFLYHTSLFIRNTDRI